MLFEAGGEDFVGGFVRQAERFHVVDQAEGVFFGFAERHVVQGVGEFVIADHAVELADDIAAGEVPGHLEIAFFRALGRSAGAGIGQGWRELDEAKLLEQRGHALTIGGGADGFLQGFCIGGAEVLQGLIQHADEALIAAELFDFVADGETGGDETVGGVIGNAEFFFNEFGPAHPAVCGMSALGESLFLLEVIEGDAEADLGGDGHQGMPLEMVEQVAGIVPVGEFGGLLGHSFDRMIRMDRISF